MENVQAIMLGVKSEDVKTSIAVAESGKRVDNQFLCKKDDEVIVGRLHTGDENKKTQYKYGKLSIMNDNSTYEVILSDYKWSDSMKESNSSFHCPPSCIIVGREHSGDENGLTRYAYKEVGIRKKATRTEPAGPYIPVYQSESMTYNQQVVTIDN